MTLNVLYCADNNYAPFAGISVFSLLKSNTDIDEINVYFVGYNVSEKNIRRLHDTVRDFGDTRKLIYIDAEETINKIIKLAFPMYRNSYTTNLRLFFEDFLLPDAKTLLYLDCDTLIVDSLAPLLELNFGDSAVAGVQESLTGEYRRFIGMSNDIPYINAGILFINIENWKAKNYTERLRDMIKVGNFTMNPDQDCLNRLFVQEIKILPPKYNLQPFHSAYSWKNYAKTFDVSHYYSEEVVAESVKNPVIYHTYRFCGQFPWHNHSVHPITGLWLDIKSESRFADEPPVENGQFLFKVERILYRILPSMMFLKIFKAHQTRQTKKYFDNLKSNQKEK